MNEIMAVVNHLPMTLSQFHFLRPMWLLAAIPALLLAWYFWQQKSSAVNWYGAINKQLLEHLLEASPNNTVRWPWFVLLLTWTVAIIALAGPTWEKIPQPVHQKSDALVIIFDLSLSMRAEDIKPSRLVRARHKTLDILKNRDEGLTGLIAYSGDAHIVSPLTDDNATVANLLPALSPEMMPVNGSDPYTAVQLARQLFKNAGHQDGRILLITDGVTANDVEDISDIIAKDGFELSILGVGTSQGAPIPMKNGFIRDKSGNIVVPKLPRDRLDNLARANDGRYADVSLGDKDIDFLLPAPLSNLTQDTILSEREFDQWHDRGHWLVLILLPFALLAFRRGWLLSSLLLVVTLEPQNSYAFEWNDLWQRADQQAAQNLASGDAEAAAKQFKDKRWQGSAQYKANDFEAAQENFKQFNNADAHYNRANALAKAGKLDEAIKAYDEALKHQPEMDDAIFNKKLVEDLKNQQQNSSDQNQDQDQDSDSDSDSEQSEKGEQQNQQGKQSDKNNDQQNGDDQQSSDNQQQDGQDSENQQNAENDNQSPEQQQKDSEQSSDTKNDGADLPEEQAEKQQQAKPSEQNDDSEENKQANQAKPTPTEMSEADQENKQKQQAMEQWLRQIPDEPSGLLRRKFDYEYRLRQRNQQQTQREQPKW
jgi:Ca-activated chloride channel homolog